MKELQQHIKTEQHEIESKKQEKLVHTMKLRRGLRFYKYNTSTGDLKEVEVERTAVMQEKNGKVDIVRKGKSVWDDKAFYFQALNEKNAAKKVKKMLDSIGLEYNVIND